MRIRLAVAALVLAAPAFAQEPAKPAPRPALGKDECAVWARELAFSDSVAAHDAKAFGDFVAEGAVFSANLPVPVRGRAAIAKEWAGIIDGSQLRLTWYPKAVAIGGEPDIAYSTGPALIELPDPKAPNRYALTTFFSTWHRDKDGTWRVLLDGGVGAKSATEADVAAFRAGRKTCPAG
ncbi:Ketosteroid isomerase-like protein [Lysobacter dokdonensis DS-58]|uniref:Ketosteroid isomerase-like protein n=1 Tax=Lysobacter dokdonensis DS-58 TaxID=1300345 RepID=A0A0A2WLI8_9GAMM|nr:nuclear transport factor 2 family protein [Lysobacter dokdonensis]KGQ19587.1 Ketosteroid isomerase-like protein [Lysobacter dokdonensis DS-58]